MASKELKTRIILRNDTAKNWADNNPTPSKAEFCVETDTKKYKLGDGVTSWANLPYYNHINDSTKSKLDSLIQKLDSDAFGKVDGVTVNGQDVVTDKVANIIIATISYTETENSANDDSLTNATVMLHKIAKTGKFSDLIGSFNVIDSTDSTSATDALSARQGNELKKIIQGIPKGTSYTTIQNMVTALNAATKDTFNVGANLYIEQLSVPDFWVSKVNTASNQYTYTSDNALISEINTKGNIQLGYFSISKLETEKVDLTNLITRDELTQTLQPILARLTAIETDATIVRTTDTLIINGGTSTI